MPRIAGERIIEFIPFPMLLVICEMQSVLSRIWTRVVVSISYDDIHYTTSTSSLAIVSGKSIAILSTCQQVSIRRISKICVLPYYKHVLTCLSRRCFGKETKIGKAEKGDNRNCQSRVRSKRKTKNQSEKRHGWTDKIKVFEQTDGTRKTTLELAA